MRRALRLAVLTSGLLAAGAAMLPTETATAAPLSVSAAAIADMHAVLRAEPVASRPKPVRSAAKSRKSGVRVTTGDVNGDGTPDVVTVQPKRKPSGANKPTTKPTAKPTGGVHVQ